ncbi:MAG: rhodanese-like domain-containing protein [bacterium]|jgi:rhodanese-related sulfurtransferase
MDTSLFAGMGWTGCTHARRVGRWVLVLCIGALLGACAGKISDADIEDDLATLKDVQRAVDEPSRGILLVDTRSRAEWEADRIPGSTNLTLTQITGREGERDPRLARFSGMIVYGQDPSSSTARAMTKKLITTGYSDVQFFPGGMFEWTNAKLPTRSGAPGEGMRER